MRRPDNKESVETVRLAREREMEAFCASQSRSREPVAKSKGPVAALLVAERALKLAMEGLPPLPPGGVAILRHPGHGWHESLLTALSAGALGQRIVRGDAFKPLAGRHARATSERLESALAEGFPVVAMVESDADERALPGDLARAADLRLVVHPLSWDDCCEVAAQVKGAGSVVVAPPSPEVLARLSPRDWLLACRQGQDAATLLRRVVEVASHEEARQDVPTARLEHLPGMGRHFEAWAHAMVDDLTDYRAGTLPWEDLDRGILLSGPPGCGKTSFAAALAGSAGVPLVAASYAQWQGKGHQGDMMAAMSRTFADARAAAPCVLLVDEVDSFGARGSGDGHNGDYSRQVVNAFLAEVDGAVENTGVVLVGATNDPGAIEPALLRSGRLERHVTICLPGPDDMERIFRVHLAGTLVGVCLAGVARAAAGGSGADAERWCREARRRARVGRREMTVDDLLAVLPPRRPARPRPAFAFTRQGLVRVH